MTENFSLGTRDECGNFKRTAVGPGFSVTFAIMVNWRTESPFN